MKVVRRWIQVFGMACAVGLASSAPAQATPIVTATVTPTGSLFHYDYSITFNPVDDQVTLQCSVSSFCREIRSSTPRW